MAKIVKIESLGQQDSYDIEVDHPDHQYYLANGLLTSNSAHAKCYAMISMQTAFLRTYYPLEFFAGLLMHGKADDLQSYVDDIKRQGYKVLPVDINKSKENHVIEGEAIRLALGSVLGVGASAAKKIVKFQPYENFREYLYKTGGGKTATLPLVKVGAFNDLEENVALLERRYELWMDNPKLRQKKHADEFERQYFDIADVEPLSVAKVVEYENELLGFNLRGTPFKLFDRDKKIEMLSNEGLLMNFNEFVESDENTAVVPVIVKDVRERAQSRGGMMAWIKFADIDGTEFDAPCFATIWRYISKSTIKGNVYLTTFNRKLDEPRNVLVGKPGWAQSERSAKSAMINVDEVE